MVRQVVCAVPLHKKEEVHAFLKKTKHIHHLTCLNGEDRAVFQLNCTDMKAGVILQAMHEFGIGVDFGITNTVPLQSCVPFISDYTRVSSMEDLSQRKKVAPKLQERLPLEEIYQAISSQNKLGFDYLIMCAVAALLASIGLLANNVVVIVASMLLSPLMGPILGMVFGTIIADWKLVKTSIRNEMLGVLTSVVVGVLVAACITGTDLSSFPTEEMNQRGTVAGLIAGLAIAIPSGAGVALAVTAGTVNPLVGVAISASVLPPCTNFGVCLVLGIATSGNSGAQSDDLLRIGGISFVLWLINCVAIFVVAMLFFRLKQVRNDAKTKDQVWTPRAGDLYASGRDLSGGFGPTVPASLVKPEHFQPADTAEEVANREMARRVDSKSGIIEDQKTDSDVV